MTRRVSCDLAHPRCTSISRISYLAACREHMLAHHHCYPLLLSRKPCRWLLSSSSRWQRHGRRARCALTILLMCSLRGLNRGPLCAAGRVPSLYSRSAPPAARPHCAHALFRPPQVLGARSCCALPGCSPDTARRPRFCIRRCPYVSIILALHP